MLTDHCLFLLRFLKLPDNPFLFISDVAGRMVRARDNEEEFHRLDRLFTSEHVEALFRLFDKEQNGFVSLQQYKTGTEYFFTPRISGIDFVIRIVILFF